MRLANRPDASTWPAAEKRIEQELSLSNLTVSTFERRHKEDASLETVLDSVLRESAARGAVLVAVEKDEGVRLHALFYNRDRRIPEYRTHFLALSATSDNVEVAAIKAREAVLATLYEGIPS